MSKSDLKAEKSARKRKLSEAEVEDGTTAPKKAKKDKSDKKSKKEKEFRKSRKQIMAEEAEALNAAEYDVEDKAIIEEGTAEVKKDSIDKKDKKEKKKGKASKVEEAGGEDIEGEDDKKKKQKQKQSKKDKKSKKTKEEEEEEEEVEKQIDGGAAAAVEPTYADGKKEEKAPKKAKKDKKDKKSKKKEQKDEEDKVEDADADADEADGKDATKDRFICFVGNLPFTATKADIEAHLAPVRPSSVRLLTERDDPSRSRGIAFVEFAHAAQMRACLARFHHTELGGRRINVELTAGGGGRTDARMGKVKERNRKLNEERARRIAREEEEKREKKKNKGNKDGAAAAAVDREEDYVHPSRRAHVPGRRT